MNLKKIDRMLILTKRDSLSTNETQELNELLKDLKRVLSHEDYIKTLKKFKTLRLIQELKDELQEMKK